MKIEVTQEKLSKALAAVSRVAAGARATLPILSNILIKAKDNQVSLTATNLDMAIVEYVPVISAEDGAITAPARLLVEFVSNLPRGEVIKIETEGIKLKVVAGNYKSTIIGMAADDFPELPEIDEKAAVKYKMGVDQFKLGVSEVVVAACSDTLRPILTGVCFLTVDNDLHIVATDGYRVAERRFIEKVSSEVQATVPAASLQEVLRTVSDEMEEVEIIFDETQARFRIGEIELTSKLLSGTFPDYRPLIPKDVDIEVVLEREELLRITKIAGAFSREINRAIVCEFDAKEGIFAVYSILNELGENRSEIKTEVNKDGKIKIDSKYLMTALNAIEEPKVRIGISTGGGPMLLRNEKSDVYRHIVMPLNV